MRILRIVVAIFLFCFVSSGFGRAEGHNVGHNDSLEKTYEVIKSVDINVYPGATFVYGNSEIGYCFTTKESVETVKAWYKKQLSSWQVNENKDSCFIYNGKEETNIRDLVMENPLVSIRENSNLPEEHNLDKKMTTEIIIMVPQQDIRSP